MFKFDTTIQQNTTTVTLDGRTVELPARMSVAAALMGTGETVSRVSPTSGKPCSPHCLMGVCFECMMEIDGVQRQACMTQVADGMEINRRLDDKEESNS